MQGGSVRGLRLLVAGAIAVPAVLFAGFAYFDRERELRVAVKDIQQTTAVLEEHARKVFETHQLVMQQLLRRLDGMPWEAVAPRRDIYLDLRSTAESLPQIDGVFGVGPDGQNWLTSRKFPATAGVDFSDRDYFLAQRDHDAGTYVSRAYSGKISKHPIFNLSRRRSTSAGAFDGVVGVSVSVDYFVDFYSSLEHGVNHIAALTRADGEILVRYPPIDSGVARLSPQSDFMRALERQPRAGSFEAISAIDGLARLYGYRKVGDYPVYVSFGIERDAILRRWRENLVVIGGFTSLGAAGLAWLSLVVLRRTRRLNRTATDLRTTTSLLQQQKAFSDRLIASSSEGIFATDLDARISVWNPAMERLSGIAAEHATGQRAGDVFRFAQGTAVETALRNALAGKEGLIRDIGYVVPGPGQNGSFDLVCSSLRDAGGRIEGAIGLVRETTEQRRLDETLRQSQKMEAIGQLTGGVAHDFNNLLTVILGNLGHAAAGSIDERRRSTSAIQRAAEHGAALTRQLLAFARRQALNPSAIDLVDQLAGLHELLRRSLPPNIEISVDEPKDLWPVETDLNQLEVALINLALNAKDAMPNGGRLAIRLRNAVLEKSASENDAPNGEFVALSITDTGTGIPPHVRGRIFEPFFTTKEAGKGTGLGLSMVYGFAKQSGGHVDVQSEPGRGTTFTLHLPRAKEAPRPQTIAAPPESAHGPVAVLLVEDDADVADVSIAMLEHAGHRVERVESAAAALAALRRRQAFDLVVSDVYMSGPMNGLDLAREIRRRFPDLPVLLVTGAGDSIVEAMAEGFATLQKPFSRAALQEGVSIALAAALGPGSR
jgi:PAS domain S-box-containing protein